MALAGMINLDEGALVCDFAETYHIYDYRLLPAGLAATLAVGLGENSRIKRLVKKKRTGQTVSNTELLLAALIDRVGALMCLLGAEEPEMSFVEECYVGVLKQETRDGLQRFGSVDDFKAERNRLINGGKHGTE